MSGRLTLAQGFGYLGVSECTGPLKFEQSHRMQ